MTHVEEFLAQGGQITECRTRKSGTITLREWNQRIQMGLKSYESAVLRGEQQSLFDSIKAATKQDRKSAHRQQGA